MKKMISKKNVKTNVNTMRAIDALQEAEKIAFAPFLFQATIALRKLGIFDLIFQKRVVGGADIEGIARELELSSYGVGILLEIAETSDLVCKNEQGKFELTKIGYFLNYDKTTDVNINFSNDVCYKGMYHLTDTIKNGKPEGLKELGSWNTIYEGLSSLDSKVQNSWFEFVHHYSDNAFDDALKIVFRNKPKHIFDIGGNTGKFAISCCDFDEEVKITIVDLPGQLQKALENAKSAGFSSRISGHEIDWLAENPKIPANPDVIWMSQFLDCFSKEEIVKILKECVSVMDDDTELFIMETFTDRQKFDNAKYILQATSLYFAAMANGNSKMYGSTEMIALIEEAGLSVKEDVKLVSEYHTILVCKKK